MSMCEMFAHAGRHGLPGACGGEQARRGLKAKKAIPAFQRQLDGAGFSLVEMLSPCPTNWKMGTLEACSGSTRSWQSSSRWVWSRTAAGRC